MDAKLFNTGDTGDTEDTEDTEVHRVGLTRREKIERAVTLVML